MNPPTAVGDSTPTWCHNHQLTVQHLWIHQPLQSRLLLPQPRANSPAPVNPPTAVGDSTPTSSYVRPSSQKSLAAAGACVWTIWKDVKLLPWLAESLFLIRFFAITMNQFWVFYQAFIQSPFQLQGVAMFPGRFPNAPESMVWAYASSDLAFTEHATPSVSTSVGNEPVWTLYDGKNDESNSIHDAGHLVRSSVSTSTSISLLYPALGNL